MRIDIGFTDRAALAASFFPTRGRSTLRHELRFLRARGDKMAAEVRRSTLQSPTSPTASMFAPV
jgi:hypothetical protein